MNDQGHFCRAHGAKQVDKAVFCPTYSTPGIRFGLGFRIEFGCVHFVRMRLLPEVAGDA